MVRLNYGSESYSKIMFGIIEKILMISDIFIKYKLQLWDLQPKNILINCETDDIKLIMIDFDGVSSGKYVQYDYENILLLIQCLFSYYLPDCFLFESYWNCCINDDEFMKPHCEHIKNTISKTCENVEMGQKLYDLINRLY